MKKLKAPVQQKQHSKLSKNLIMPIKKVYIKTYLIVIADTCFCRLDH